VHRLLVKERLVLALRDKGYIGTGEESYYTSKKDFWEYDPATNVWTQKADFASGERSFAVGFSIGTKGYIGTGNLSERFLEYDPATNVWTRKADFAGTGRSKRNGF
jgi:N-acetylneuraminic acid mutarotase